MVKTEDRSKRVPRIGLLVIFAMLPILTVIATTAWADEDWHTGWPAGQGGNAAQVVAVGPAAAPGALAGAPTEIYRSQDNGGTWQPVAGSPQNVIALAVAEPATVYAYSWPRSGSSAGSTRGLFKSTNGGVNWQDPTGRSSADLLGPITTIAVQPGNPQVVLAGASVFPVVGNRIYRSSDGGVNWVAVHTISPLMGVGSVFEIVPAPANPNVFYAAHDVYHSGVLLKSTDGGLTWGALPRVAEPLSTPMAIAVDPADANRVVVAHQFPTGGGVRVYGSSDGGQNWSKIGQGLPQGSAFITDLIVHPRNGSTLFAAIGGDSGGLYRSDDGGGTWSRFDNAGAPALKDTKALAIDPVAGILYAATGSGVWQRSLTSAIDARFRDYYASHDGWRVLGRPIAEPEVVQGWQSQYFEKGRIEDHNAEVSDPNWRFMFGLLADELQNSKAAVPVGGDTSTVSYASINALADPAKRIAPPAGFVNGIWKNVDGSVFVPYDAQLMREAGHNVAPVFWDYINRDDLFPGGWLHDIGLPMTEAVQAVVDKGDVKGRTIILQTFQRTVLTYDQLNPPDWQVERANVGSDYLKAMGR